MLQIIELNEQQQRAVDRYEAACGGTCIDFTVFHKGNECETEDLYMKAAILALDYPGIRVKDDVVPGYEVNLESFMGASYCPNRHTLLFRGVSKKLGYSDAFLYPPYGIGGTKNEINRMFWDIANNFSDGFNKVNKTVMIRKLPDGNA